MWKTAATRWPAWCASSTRMAKCCSEHAAAQDERLRQTPAQFGFLLQALVRVNARPLAIYLDNLESLQVGPVGEDPAAFAKWRDGGYAAFWQGLRRAQERQSGRLAILGAGVPFTRLADDALWRMLLWFPNLRRLSEASRGGLVSRLAGHPRGGVSRCADRPGDPRLGI